MLVSFSSCTSSLISYIFIENLVFSSNKISIFFLSCLISSPHSLHFILPPSSFHPPSLFISSPPFSSFDFCYSLYPIWACTPFARDLRQIKFSLCTLSIPITTYSFYPFLPLFPLLPLRFLSLPLTLSSHPSPVSLSPSLPTSERKINLIVQCIFSICHYVFRLLTSIWIGTSIDSFSSKRTVI